MTALRTAVFRHLFGGSPRRVFEACLPAGMAGGRPGLIIRYPEARVLVIAPHPDDEAIGCGGALLAHSEAGASVDLVFLTDGRRGVTRAGIDPVGLRQQEARACAERLRARPHFLGAEDGALFPTRAGALGLAELIRACRPEMLYLPFAWDTHEDHWQANRLVRDALREIAAPLPRVRAYEVWSPLPANRIADITGRYAAKIELVRHYASQLADTDYVTGMRGLNAYRALQLPLRQGYAEAFYECPAADYMTLVGRMEGSA